MTPHTVFPGGRETEIACRQHDYCAIFAKKTSAVPDFRRRCFSHAKSISPISSTTGAYDQLQCATGNTALRCVLARLSSRRRRWHDFGADLHGTSGAPFALVRTYIRRAPRRRWRVDRGRLRIFGAHRGPSATRRKFISYDPFIRRRMDVILVR